jgi:hypothetical protein
MALTRLARPKGALLADLVAKYVRHFETEPSASSLHPRAGGYVLGACD